MAEREDPGPIIAQMWDRMLRFLDESGQKVSDKDLGQIWLGFVSGILMVSEFLCHVKTFEKSKAIGDELYRETKQITDMMKVAIGPERN